MCSKERLTVLVPAPEEPVTAMMGCFWDMELILKKLLNKIDTQVLSSKPGDRPKIIIFFEPLFSQFSQNPGQTHLIFER
jgi:hypothetical protein